MMKLFEEEKMFNTAMRVISPLFMYIACLTCGLDPLFLEPFICIKV